MKLVDFISDLETKLSTLPSSETMAGISTNLKSDFTISGPSLKMFEKQLYECDEFQNVLRINFLDSPTYLIDKETSEPISVNRNFIGGDVVTKTVSTFKFNEDEGVRFNKFVDLYSIRVVKAFRKDEDITKPGVWVYPTTYDTMTFKQDPKQIRVIWDQEQLEQTLNIIGSTETPKERLIRMFTDALDSMEPNIPHDYIFFIRCSERSVAIKEENESKTTLGSMVFSGATNLYGAFGISGHLGD